MRIPHKLLKSTKIPGVILIVAALAASPPPEPILARIRETWTALTRSNRQIAEAAVDPKFHPQPDGRWPVFIAASENIGHVRAELKAQVLPADLRKIVLLHLPAADGSQGLLYLPRPYVVPGGRFNEMYGWDSYFIQLGLLRDGLVPLARDMADNFLYEIGNYGTILNANRTYYLTRSQPPFLTEMVLGAYRRTGDKAWLRAAMPAVDAYYRYWTTGPHLTETGLSRYWDSGDGPAPEVLSAERDVQGRTHYDAVKEFYRTHRIADYDVSQYYDATHDSLTPLFYKGDRSMRESGFDPSNRFGPFNIDIIHYNPVCLNSLLYRMENEAAEIDTELGHSAEAAQWRKRAAHRAGLINTLLWDEKTGLYLDYDFVHRRRRNYPFLTTFYPLWAGIATPVQARAVERNLALFEVAGGLQTSTNRSGSQWDAPYGWAPLELIAVEGLRRCGFNDDAGRISRKFLSEILDVYRRTGAIFEKYDVVNPGTGAESRLQFGYRSNEIGFGWTNAAFTAMLDRLPAASRANLLKQPAP